VNAPGNGLRGTWRYPECAYVRVIWTPALFGGAEGVYDRAFLRAKMTESGSFQRPRPPRPGSTYSRSLDMLARAPRSARDLRRRLLLKGEPEADVDATIERLTAAGLLDDAAYARAFVRSKVSSQAFSRRRLHLELAKRGVARDVAEAAILEVLHDDDVNESANIERVARKKLRALRGLDEETQRRRLFAYLARRGYDVDEVRAVLRAIQGSARP
jgi:regulatory protein